MAKIGLIQVDNKIEYDIKKRQDMLVALAEKCLDEGADLVFFPEAFQYDGNRGVLKAPDKLAEMGEEWKARCSLLARKFHAYVAPWDYEVRDGKIYNSSYILDRDGNEIEVTGYDLLAKALCHEIDHLDGIIYTDKVIRMLGADEVE